MKWINLLQSSYQSALLFCTSHTYWFNYELALCDNVSEKLKNLVSRFHSSTVKYSKKPRALSAEPYRCLETIFCKHLFSAKCAKQLNIIFLFIYLITKEIILCAQVWNTSRVVASTLRINTQVGTMWLRIGTKRTSNRWIEKS